MKKRPMLPLFEALTDMGADFKFLEKKGHLPVEVTGAAFGGKKPKAEVSIDISESTQFLSALMMTAPMLESGLKINITSKKTDGSYIRITSNMMRQFGCEVDHEGAEYVIPADDSYVAGSLPDRTGCISSMLFLCSSGSYRWILPCKECKKNIYAGRYEVS